ncbi:MAG: hypothetical protein CMF62_03040 [Magnetococcales bacterium]|nr:hypothetical protein [Magnetococcales bacterium]
MKNLFSGNTPEDAAQKTWNRLSSYINQNVPRFAFSLERINDKKKFHFMVKETIKGGSVNYSLESLSFSNSEKKLNKFLDKVEQFKLKEKQVGGRRKRYEDDDLDDDDLPDLDDELPDLDDDDDDLDDDHKDMILQLYRTVSRPINYWYYNPVVYGIDYIFMPTFTAPLIPYVEIDLSPYN